MLFPIYCQAEGRAYRLPLTCHDRG